MTSSLLRLQAHPHGPGSLKKTAPFGCTRKQEDGPLRVHQHKKAAPYGAAFTQ